MPSSFSWLDPSDDQRQRLLAAIDKFKESDTRDELGLGSIRDGFADALFPGTTVLMTRARYFLFTPWIYQRLEQSRTLAAEIEAKARRAEVQLIHALLASGEKTGVIGNQAKGELKRLPSSIYWLGLGSWGIRTYDGLREDYHAAFDRLRDQRANAVRDDDGMLVDRTRGRSWDKGLPPAPEEFPKNSGLALTVEEARYLIDRIQHAHPRTLLAFLAREGRPAAADFAWDHSQQADFPQEVVALLPHARNLAETMQGAAWLYNLLLAEARAKTGGSIEPVSHFRQRSAEWATDLQARDHALATWDSARFWQVVAPLANVSHRTRQFVDEWVKARPWTRSDGGADHHVLRQLVQQREQTLKGPRARLGNPRALEIWGGESGTGRLDYRWATAARLLGDIYDAVGRGGDRARAA